MNDERTTQQAHRPSQSQPVSHLSSLQIMFAAILAIGLILAINFSTRITSNRSQREIFAQVELEVEQLMAEQATLIAERDYVQSDVFVEQWARGEGKMVRAGEVLVVPLVPVNPEIQATVAPPTYVEVQTSPPKPENWMLWWALFFDSSPPNF
jgi:cell division protein FtsB